MSESAILSDVLALLRNHPRVAWVERLNSGAVKRGGRFVRFSWIGAPDVIGQMTDGRLLAVECKAPDGRLRTEQAAFLSKVSAAGGVALIARSAGDLGGL